MNKLQLPLILLMISILLNLASCKKDDNPSANTFKDVIAGGGSFEEPVLEQTVEEEQSSEYEDEEGVTWLCKTTTYDMKKGSGGGAGFPLFSPNANVVYPGNMLQGNSLNEATPNIIAVARAGGSFSSDVIDGNLQSSFTVDMVNKDQVTNAINNIVAGSSGVVPANFNMKVTNVQSREQFALEVGVDVDTKFYDLEAKINFSTDNEYNRFVINLNQSFYTISYTIPTSEDQLFAASVRPEDLAKYVGPGNPATYVSDVTYGRIYYMLVESTSSITEMNASIDASFKGITNKVEGEVDVDYMSELDNLKIQVFAYGGEASSSLLTLGTTDLSELAALLAESSDIRSGKAISYVVRSVYDNQIVSTQLNTKYDVTNCEPSGAYGAPIYTAHWTGNVVSKMGPVGAAFNVAEDFYLISKDGTEYMKSSVGSLDGPYPINDLGLEGECPFDGIGAACNLDGNEDPDRFYTMIIDKTGTKYSYINGNWKFSSQVQNVSSIAEGSYPFNLSGVGALAFHWKNNDGPSSRHFFSGDGDRYSIYINNPNSFGYARHIDNFSSSYDCPFEKVGAAIGFYLGDDLFYILFDGAGINYVVYGNVNGSGPHTYLGPFPL